MAYLSVTDALSQLCRTTSPISQTQTVPLGQAAGRTLARTVTSDIDLPPFDRAAMDGYALRAEDTPGKLYIGGHAAAGEPAHRLKPREAIRVLTGAPLPHGADAVLEQERAERQGPWVTVPEVKPGRNVSARGSDLTRGSTLVRAGQRLSAVEVGLLGAVGLSTVPVFRPPQVLLVTTGNELQSPGKPLGPGQIYDANLPLFSQLLKDWGALVTVDPAAGDTLNDIERALNRDLEPFDLIITTGGVSVGDHDHVIEFLTHEADLLFWRLDMHPGKSIAAARLRNRTIIALSGNPGAALTSWYLVVSPLLAHLYHARWPVREVFGRLKRPFPKKTRETRLIRARFLQTSTGLEFDTDLAQASDIIGSYALADGLVRIPHGADPLPAGAAVTALAIPGLGPWRLTWTAPDDDTVL